jgi:hypothetical protein
MYSIYQRNAKSSEHVAELIRRVRIADEGWRSAKPDVHARAKLFIADQLSGYLNNRDMRVRDAFEAGISLAKIGREDLGSTNPTIVRDSLARTADPIAPVVSA